MDNTIAEMSAITLDSHQKSIIPTASSLLQITLLAVRASNVMVVVDVSVGRFPVS